VSACLALEKRFCTRIIKHKNFLYVVFVFYHFDVIINCVFMISVSVCSLTFSFCCVYISNCFSGCNTQYTVRIVNYLDQGSTWWPRSAGKWLSRAKITVGIRCIIQLIISKQLNGSSWFLFTCFDMKLHVAALYSIARGIDLPKIRVLLFSVQFSCCLQCFGAVGWVAGSVSSS